MRIGRKGFTLIEVAIFLAITGLLFAGVTVGVQNSIYQQRTNDSVQNFVEFLRNIYSEVLNVQSNGGGRSEKAVYGKLVTFGESRNLAGERIEGEGTRVFVYTVIGDVGNVESGGALDLLYKLNANVVRDKVENGTQTVVLAGIPEHYTPKWAADIEPSCGDKVVADCDFTPAQGMLLIVRHPNSGTVYTYYSSKLAEVNDIVHSATDVGANPFAIRGGGNYLTSGDFKMEQVDFCMNTTGGDDVFNRPDVRIVQGARNASGIEVVYSDTEGYKCGK